MELRNWEPGTAVAPKCTMEHRTFIRTDKNGTAYYNVVYPCFACRGTGYRPEYAHIEGGVCFECSGSGHYERIEKVYTEEYLQLKAERAERKEARRKASWTVEGALAKMGYGPMIGIVTDAAGRISYGDDFEWLTKTMGCHWEKRCGGLLTSDVSRATLEHSCLPDSEKYSIVPVRWDELLEVDAEECQLVWKEKAAKAALAAHTYCYPPKPEFKSDYVGAVGDKVNMALRLARVSGFESRFGYTSVYTFEDDRHNKIVWKTGKSIDHEVGDVITVSGTIKEHNEYRGEKQTVLTRCKVEAA